MARNIALRSPLTGLLDCKTDIGDSKNPGIVNAAADHRERG
jgi:hypothetical protein